MKAANTALVVLAGFGLVASNLAYADTLPGAAVPSTVHARAHAAKIARLTEKRPDGTAPSDIVSGAGVVIVSLLAGSAIGVGVDEAVKKTTVVEAGS